jgi:hypothetical protein
VAGEARDEERRPWWSAAGSDLLFTAVIAAIALYPRLYVAIAWAREPVWDGH